MLEGRSVREALRDLLRRGTDGRRGLRICGVTSNAAGDLRKRGDLAGTLDRVQQMLDQVLAAEREQLAGEEGDDARLAEMTLDDLPPQVGSAVRELSDYDWHSDEARAGYQQIQQMLQREVLDAQFAGMKQALSGDDPEAMQRVRDMLADLNQLLADHARGIDTPEQFDRVHGPARRVLPRQPRNVEELIDSLARRQAAAERMMRSLSREQRAELAELMAAGSGRRRPAEPARPAAGQPLCPTSRDGAWRSGRHRR